jgi:lipopolysaccharide/colanic/teichoic acid biosynthesis glycosyltransferase
MAKTLFDKLFSLIFLILLSPVLITVAIIIKFNDGSPVFLRQDRAGLHGKTFKLIKFRTMNDKKNAQGELLPDAQRITKVGSFLRKTSLDELPQLVNILKGDISFVGPRPLHLRYLPRYNAFQKRRLKVKQGITGWAQVNGRNTISWDKKFELDVWYVDQQSFQLDLKILWMTFIRVIKSQDIDQGENMTMEEFMGNSSVKDGDKDV